MDAAVKRIADILQSSMTDKEQAKAVSMSLMGDIDAIHNLNDSAQQQEAKRVLLQCLVALEQGGGKMTEFSGLSPVLYARLWERVVELDTNGDIRTIFDRDDAGHYTVKINVGSNAAPEADTSASDSVDGDDFNEPEGSASDVSDDSTYGYNWADQGVPEGDGTQFPRNESGLSFNEWRQQAGVITEAAYDIPPYPFLENNLGSMSPADQEIALKAHFKAMDKRYVERLVRSMNKVAARDKPLIQGTDMKKAISQEHAIYFKLMGLSCLLPLRQGVNIESVCRSVGQSVGLVLFSKEFRKTMLPKFQTPLEQFKDGFAGFHKRREERRDNRLADKTAELQEKDLWLSKPQSWLEEHGLAKLASVLGTGRDRIEHKIAKIDARRDFRPFYSVERAALTEMALNEYAYDAMRQRNEFGELVYDPAEVLDQYKSAKQYLYESANRDGVDIDEMARQVRLLTMAQIRENPMMVSRYEQMCHGEFYPTEPKVVQRADTGKKMLFYDGSFCDREGEVCDTGTFTVRSPKDMYAHFTDLKRAMTQDLLSSANVDVLDNRIMSYVLGNYVEAHEKGSFVDGLPKPSQRVFRGPAAMVRAMRDDGVPANKRRELYITALSGAMQAVGEIDPDLDKRWVEKYGMDDREWRDRIQSLLENSDYDVPSDDGVDKVYKTRPGTAVPSKSPITSYEM